MKKPRIYISGPMTGITDYNFPAFNAAAAAWREAGWDVANPAEAFGGATDREYYDYALHDIKLLKTCDAIAMLPGWDGEGARGSVWEYLIAAFMLGIPTYNAEVVEFAEAAVVRSHPAESVEMRGASETVLQEAQRLVHGDRNAAYGHPRIDYKATGRMFGAILERWLGREIPDVPPRIAALMMVAVKVSREAGKHKRDNCTDMAGYAECVNWIADSEAGSISGTEAA